jgi:hypothetical protein
MTRPGFEPTNYRTRGKHANHYTTDAVAWQKVILKWVNTIYTEQQKETSFFQSLQQQKTIILNAKLMNCLGGTGKLDV